MSRASPYEYMKCCVWNQTSFFQGEAGIIVNFVWKWSFDVIVVTQIRPIYQRNWNTKVFKALHSEKSSVKQTLLFERTFEIIQTNHLQLHHILLRSWDIKVPIWSVGILHICDIWILLRKIVIYLVGRTFYLRGPFCYLSWRGWCPPGICLVTPGCFNIQTSHGFKNLCLFSLNRFRMKWDIFSISITVCFHYITDSWLTSLSLILTAKTSTKITFLADKIYYNFSQEYSKITNMWNP